MIDGGPTHTHVSIPSVIVSFVLSFLGAYSTVCLAEQHRIADALKSKLIPQPMYLMLMAVSMGAGCIWSMHFVGMSAVTFEDSNQNSIAIRYDIIESLLSLVTCVVFAYAGFFISSRDKMFSRDKEEIFELIIAEGKKDSMDAVRSRYYLMKVALLRGTGPLLVGGTIAGSGVCVMHYIGMMAMYSPMKVHWDAGIIAASVFIAVIAATAAFWIIFRVLALYPAVESLRLLSALVMALAVCGMHYTGLMAASYTIDTTPPRPVFGPTMSHESANIAAIVIGLSISMGVSMVVQAELRAWRIYLHDRLKSSRKVLALMRERHVGDQLLLDYEAKNERVVTHHEVNKSCRARKVSQEFCGSNNDSKVLPMLEGGEEEAFCPPPPLTSSVSNRFKNLKHILSRDCPPSPQSGALTTNLTNTESSMNNTNEAIVDEKCYSQREVLSDIIRSHSNFGSDIINEEDMETSNMTNAHDHLALGDDYDGDFDEENQGI